MNVLALALLMSAAPAPNPCWALTRLSTPKLNIVAAREGPFCHATLVARPRPAARIGIELWLPPPEAWSGRYYQMGNGGFAGHIDAATLRAAARRGDAAAATDTGHWGDGFDARWARDRPDLVEDYASRSIKVTSDAAKLLVRTYYGRPPRRRYFMGCSFGGRQALVAAARWPADWDGVIAGAPALRWPERLVAFARIQLAMQAPRAAIPSDRLPSLIAAARVRCPFGSASGCGVRALADRCASSGSWCLTPPQRRALATIEAAGYPLAQADAEGWRQWMLRPDPRTGSQLVFVNQAFRYLFGRGERWSLATADDDLRIAADLQRPFAVRSVAAFEARGGRVLSYFGLADPVLPPAAARSDARAAGAGPNGYRLFLVPGMGHCQGGPDSPRFGQSLTAPAGSDDASHDIRRMLEAWVEHGAEPRQLVVGTARSAVYRRIVPIGIF